jgi:hypothetical protein
MRHNALILFGKAVDVRDGWADCQGIQAIQLLEGHTVADSGRRGDEP